MTRLLIVQPYVPSYRVAFFQSLRSRLEASDVELRIVAGHPQGSSRLRSDEAGAGVVDAFLRQRTYELAGASLNLRFIAEHMRRWQPDMVVVEQAIKNFEVYPLMAKSVLGRGSMVGMWGQGRTFSTPQGLLAAAAKDWLTLRSEWFFAYTSEGAEHVTSRGFPAGRVTVLNNTIDTETLFGELERVDEDELRQFRLTHGLTAGRTALFMGGVDAHKGINFLLEAAETVRSAIPDFRLVIAGTGSSMEEVRLRLAGGAPIVLLGRVEGHEKALALRAADVMMIPRWVGLVAVDSLVAGNPIVTTRHASHSPEYDYLNGGRNAVVTEHELAAYAAGVSDLLQDLDRRASLSEQCREDSRRYSLEAMVRHFAEGVLAWRDAGDRRHRRETG